MRSELGKQYLREMREAYSAFLAKAHQLNSFLEIEAGEVSRVENAGVIILVRVCDSFGVSPAIVKGRLRTERIVNARWFTMVFMRELLDLTHQEIGDFFGRDHGTSIYAQRWLTYRLKSDELNRKRYDQLKAEIIEDLKSCARKSA